jgi:hypothetical protein
VLDVRLQANFTQELLGAFAAGLAAISQDFESLNAAGDRMARPDDLARASHAKLADNPIGADRSSEFNIHVMAPTSGFGNV